MPKIFIDPGHGGADPGAVSGNRREKGDNLTYALELRRLFELQGCEIIMARAGDTALSLTQRTTMANNAGADVYLSCHRNAGGGTGIELWLHSQAPVSYIKWAQDMIAGFKALPMPIRNSKNVNRVSEGVFRGYPGTLTGNFAVNRESTMPSILIELGFMGRDDAAFDAHYKEYAEMICRATCKFLGVAYKEPVTPPVDTSAETIAQLTKERDAARQEAAEHKARADGLMAGLQDLVARYTQ